MTVRIVESLEAILRANPEMILAIAILDKDGVPIVSTGEEIRNRNQLSTCFLLSLEQARKLGMGEQKFWTFRYESHQMAILNLTPFLIFILGAATADTGDLCALGVKLRPILNECEHII